MENDRNMTANDTHGGQQTDHNKQENANLQKKHSLLEVFLVSTKLGFTSFGGPIAHLGYFHDEYVHRRRWLDERAYADLVALSQFLPGPASSQVGLGIGVMRAGLMGGIVAFLGFTLPSVIALVLFALVLQGFDVGQAGWIQGLKIVAVAIVAHAILGMASKLTPDTKRRTLALIAILFTLLWPTVLSQVLIIGLAALVGYWLYRGEQAKGESPVHIPISKTFAITCLTLFFALLFLLPILRDVTSLDAIAVFDSFYRAGSLVFGGGHVVLPLLERELVPTGLLSEEAFLAGYGATQAVPGPLFTFAAYLGTMMNGIIGAVLATIAIFLPGFLLLLGALPFWNKLRNEPKIQGALFGVNAAVVGLLIAALFHPIWTSSVHSPLDFSLAVLLFGMLAIWKLPPWTVVVAGCLGGILIGVLS
ncbi:chromate efflux transporter [Bacillus horti]|uniref:Chromate transporter n=1 Tax=Caldalkalibacillus horti TaxID=77523 RepID=A0ABT9W1H9_9BACI|nr:chromate efflux transporter [Bacillus horti]MDQ0167097.1 chromate transporter [Bacillus horti]